MLLQSRKPGRAPLRQRLRNYTKASSVLVTALFLLPSHGYSSTFCEDEEWMSFDGWENWQAITEIPVMSYAHGENWVGIFVNNEARDTYQKAGVQFPECAAVVKAIYTDADGAAVLRLTMMVKMPEGYDPEHGDWWYGDSESTGTVIGKGGRREECISCHEAAIETDYVFSDDVIETVREWSGWRD